MENKEGERGFSKMGESFDAGQSGGEIVFSKGAKKNNENPLLWHSEAQAYVELHCIQEKPHFQLCTCWRGWRKSVSLEVQLT